MDTDFHSSLAGKSHLSSVCSYNGITPESMQNDAQFLESRIHVIIIIYTIKESIT